MRTPNYSVSQKIGTLGKRVFQGGHPDAWVQEAEPVQGGDFGFDVSMWLESLGEIRGRFSVQLKSGAGVAVAGPPGGQFIQVELTPEVCNLYLQDGPVLLVFVALRDSTSSDDAEMYYLWIEAELVKRLKDRPVFDDSDPDEMTFRIPLTNRLTKKLDVSGYLDEYWTFTRVANRLRGAGGIDLLGAVSTLSPRGVSGLTSIDVRNLDRWLANESMAGAADHLWPTPKSGTSISKLKRLAEYLSHGNSAGADRLIDDLNSAELEDAEVLAELRYQEGRRSFFDGDSAGAFGKFSEASRLQPEVPKYCAAELEAAVVSSLGSGGSVAPELILKAESFQDDDVRFQLVRIFAMRGEDGRAKELIERISDETRIKAEAIFFAIQDDWSSVLGLVDRGLLEGRDEKVNKFLGVLKLRALLNIVTGDDELISVGGRPDLKISDAKALRDATILSLREAKASGWPVNSEMLLDCASAVCVTFGPDREMLSLLSDLAEKRPKLRNAQETLARIATFIDEPEVAVEALKRIRDPDPANVARLVLLLAESGGHEEAVDIALTQLLDKQHETIIDIAVAMAAVSAYRLGSSMEEGRLRDYVSEGDPSARSLLHFISGMLKHPEQRDENLDRLWEEAMQGEGIETLQDNLIQYLRPDRELDVDRIIRVCEATAKRRNLTEMESAKFAASLLRRERLQELINFTERAQEFYPNNENVGLARAVALEKIGQPAAAEQVLRRFEGSVRSDLVWARTQLLLRIGDVDELVSLTKRALAASTEHADRFHYLRTLATLYSRRDRREYLESVWRLGEIAKRDVESEEGVFLLHFLMATAAEGVRASDARVEEFQQRIREFVEKFPDSTIIKVGQAADDASPDELLSQLYEVAGITEERVAAYQKARVTGERSGSHIPVSFRPRVYAPYVSNVVDLLRVTINSWHFGESSRVIVGDAGFPAAEPSLPPILDLATVLLLVELDLFDKLFLVWSAIAIPKASLAHLSELMFGPLDTGNSDLIDRAIEAVRRNSSAILQPGGSLERDQFPGGEFTTIKAEVASRRHAYLTFDLAAAAILGRDGGVAGHCHAIWDFFRMAQSRGLLSNSEATLARLRIASWNTKGTPLIPQDVVAAALGVVGSNLDGPDDPAARAAIKFFSSREVLDTFQGMAAILVGLAKHADKGGGEAANWLVRLYFREAVLARSLGFNGGADDLTAGLAVYAVAIAYDEEDAKPVMSFIWNALEGARVAYGGSQDRDAFFRVVGRSAAPISNEIAKNHGLVLLPDEARFVDLLFSLTTPGTQDRAVLESAYFEETQALQKR